MLTITVAVEVADPAGMVEGDTEHVGSGDGPATEHVKTMAPENPLCGVSAMVLVAVDPQVVEKDELGEETEKSPDREKVAVTIALPARMKRQLFAMVPVQFPPQAVKLEPASGIADRSTVSPGTSLCEHKFPQLIKTPK